MKLRLILALLVTALLVTMAWVYADQIWGTTAAERTDIATGTGTGGQREEPGKQTGPEATTSPERQRLTTQPLTTQPKDTGEPAHTSLRGAFVSPTRWLGGGRVVLLQAPQLPEGGAMGMYGLGMEKRRAGQRGKKYSKGTRKRMAQLQGLMSPGKPLVTLDLDQNGAFVLHNPPAGLFLVEIRHPHLVNAAKVEVQVRRGQHRTWAASRPAWRGPSWSWCPDPRAGR